MLLLTQKKKECRSEKEKILGIRDKKNALSDITHIILQGVGQWEKLITRKRRVSARFKSTLNSIKSLMYPWYLC